MLLLEGLGEGLGHHLPWHGYSPSVPMSRRNSPRLNLPGVAGAVAPLRPKMEMGPEEPWHSHVETGSPLNLFVTRLSEPDSLGLPGMFLIVPFSHWDIYNRSMAVDRINQRSIQSLFTENFFFYLARVRGWRRWSSLCECSFCLTQSHRFRSRPTLCAGTAILRLLLWAFLSSCRRCRGCGCPQHVIDVPAVGVK